jgi:ankyrin repeat protein
MGFYPIHLVIMQQEEQSDDVVQFLMEEDPLSLTHRHAQSDETALHFACASNKVMVVESIVQRNDVMINIRDNQGQTPLHVACDCEHDQIVKLLLQHQDIDLNT